MKEKKRDIYKTKLEALTFGLLLASAGTAFAHQAHTQSAVS